eukprot:Rmarinus@m.23079
MGPGFLMFWAVLLTYVLSIETENAIFVEKAFDNRSPRSLSNTGSLSSASVSGEQIDITAITITSAETYLCPANSDSSVFGQAIDVTSDYVSFSVFEDTLYLTANRFNVIPSGSPLELTVDADALNGSAAGPVLSHGKGPSAAVHTESGVYVYDWDSKTELWLSLGYFSAASLFNECVTELGEDFEEIDWDDEDVVISTAYANSTIVVVAGWAQAGVAQYGFLNVKHRTSGTESLADAVWLTVHTEVHYGVSTLGASVAVAGEVVVAGVPGGSGESGRVWVYRHTDDGFVFLGEVESPYSQAGDLFGASVDASDSLIAVGAPGHQSSMGAVFVYDVDQLLALPLEDAGSNPVSSTQVQSVCARFGNAMHVELGHTVKLMSISSHSVIAAGMPGFSGLFSFYVDHASMTCTSMEIVTGANIVGGKFISYRTNPDDRTGEGLGLSWPLLYYGAPHATSTSGTCAGSTGRMYETTYCFPFEYRIGSIDGCHVCSNGTWSRGGRTNSCEACTSFLGLSFPQDRASWSSRTCEYTCHPKYLQSSEGCLSCGDVYGAVSVENAKYEGHDCECCVICKDGFAWSPSPPDGGSTLSRALASSGVFECLRYASVCPENYYRTDDGTCDLCAQGTYSIAGAAPVCVPCTVLPVDFSRATWYGESGCDYECKDGYVGGTCVTCTELRGGLPADPNAHWDRYCQAECDDGFTMSSTGCRSVYAADEDNDTVSMFVGALTFAVFVSAVALLICAMCALCIQRRSSATLVRIEPEEACRYNVDEIGIAEKYRSPVKKEGIAEEEVEDTCCICLEDFSEGDDIKRLPCDHYFHLSCIDTWTAARTECPLCKRDVRTGEEATQDPAYRASLPAQPISSSVVADADADAGTDTESSGHPQAAGTLSEGGEGESGSGRRLRDQRGLSPQRGSRPERDEPHQPEGTSETNIPEIDGTLHTGVLEHGTHGRRDDVRSDSGVTSAVRNRDVSPRAGRGVGDSPQRASPRAVPTLSPSTLPAESTPLYLRSESLLRPQPVRKEYSPMAGRESASQSPIVGESSRSSSDNTRMHSPGDTTRSNRIASPGGATQSGRRQTVSQERKRRASGSCDPAGGEMPLLLRSDVQDRLAHRPADPNSDDDTSSNASEPSFLRSLNGPSDMDKMRDDSGSHIPLPHTPTEGP